MAGTGSATALKRREIRPAGNQQTRRHVTSTKVRIYGCNLTHRRIIDLLLGKLRASIYVALLIQGRNFPGKELGLLKLDGPVLPAYKIGRRTTWHRRHRSRTGPSGSCA